METKPPFVWSQKGYWELSPDSRDSVHLRTALCLAFSAPPGSEPVIFPDTDDVKGLSSSLTFLPSPIPVAAPPEKIRCVINCKQCKAYTLLVHENEDGYTTSITCRNCKKTKAYTPKHEDAPVEDEDDEEEENKDVVVKESASLCRPTIVLSVAATLGAIVGMIVGIAAVSSGGHLDGVTSVLISAVVMAVVAFFCFSTVEVFCGVLSARAITDLANLSALDPKHSKPKVYAYSIAFDSLIALGCLCLQIGLYLFVVAGYYTSTAYTGSVINYVAMFLLSLAGWVYLKYFVPIRYIRDTPLPPSARVISWTTFVLSILGVCWATFALIPLRTGAATSDSVLSYVGAIPCFICALALAGASGIWWLHALAGLLCSATPLAWQLYYFPSGATDTPLLLGLVCVFLSLQNMLLLPNISNWGSAFALFVVLVYMFVANFVFVPLSVTPFTHATWEGGASIVLYLSMLSFVPAHLHSRASATQISVPSLPIFLASGLGLLGYKYLERVFPLWFLGLAILALGSGCDYYALHTEHSRPKRLLQDQGTELVAYNKPIKGKKGKPNQVLKLLHHPPPSDTPQDIIGFLSGFCLLVSACFFSHWVLDRPQEEGVVPASAVPWIVLLVLVASAFVACLIAFRRGWLPFLSPLLPFAFLTTGFSGLAFNVPTYRIPHAILLVVQILVLWLVGGLWYKQTGKGNGPILNDLMKIKWHLGPIKALEGPVTEITWSLLRGSFCIVLFASGLLTNLPFLAPESPETLDWVALLLAFLMFVGTCFWPRAARLPSHHEHLPTWAAAFSSIQALAPCSVILILIPAIRVASYQTFQNHDPSVPKTGVLGGCAALSVIMLEWLFIWLWQPAKTDYPRGPPKSRAAAAAAVAVEGGEVVASSSYGGPNLDAILSRHSAHLHILMGFFMLETFLFLILFLFVLANNFVIVIFGAVLVFSFAFEFYLLWFKAQDATVFASDNYVALMLLKFTNVIYFFIIMILNISSQKRSQDSGDVYILFGGLVLWGLTGLIDSVLTWVNRLPPVDGSVNMRNAGLLSRLLVVMASSWVLTRETEGYLPLIVSVLGFLYFLKTQGLGVFSLFVFPLMFFQTLAVVLSLSDEPKLRDDAWLCVQIAALPTALIYLVLTLLLGLFEEPILPLRDPACPGCCCGSRTRSSNPITWPARLKRGVSVACFLLCLIFSALPADLTKGVLLVAVTLVLLVVAARYQLFWMGLAFPGAHVAAVFYLIYSFGVDEGVRFLVCGILLVVAALFVFLAFFLFQLFTPKELKTLAEAEPEPEQNQQSEQNEQAGSDIETLKQQQQQQQQKQQQQQQLLQLQLQRPPSLHGSIAYFVCLVYILIGAAIVSYSGLICLLNDVPCSTSFNAVVRVHIFPISCLVIAIACAGVGLYKYSKAPKGAAKAPTEALTVRLVSHAHRFIDPFLWTLFGVVTALIAVAAAASYSEIDSMAILAIVAIIVLVGTLLSFMIVQESGWLWMLLLPDMLACVVAAGIVMLDGENLFFACGILLPIVSVLVFAVALYAQGGEGRLVLLDEGLPSFCKDYAGLACGINFLIGMLAVSYGQILCADCAFSIEPEPRRHVFPWSCLALAAMWAFAGHLKDIRQKKTELADGEQISMFAGLNLWRYGAMLLALIPVMIGVGYLSFDIKDTPMAALTIVSSASLLIIIVIHIVKTKPCAKKEGEEAEEEDEAEQLASSPTS